MRASFSGVEEIDELLDSAGYGIWIVLAIIAGAYVLLSVTPQPATRDTLQFFYFMVIAGGIFVMMMDRAEPSEGANALKWALTGFIGLLGIALITNLFVMGAGLSVKGTPLMLTNYLALAIFSTLSFSFTTLFGTLFFVATGEENLKALGLILFNIFEPVEDLFGITLPETLAAQPLIWVIVGLWASAHTILGQNPAWYAIPVFIDGLWLVHCNVKGGTWLVGIIAHFLNNTFFLGAVLVGKSLGWI